MATEILSSLFQGLLAVSKSALSHSSMALRPPHCSLDTPGTIIATPPPNSSAWERCVHKPCHVGSSPLFFSSKSKVRPVDPRLQPSGSWGRGGEESQGPLAQDLRPHLLTQGHSEGGWLPVVQILPSRGASPASSPGSHAIWFCVFSFGACFLLYKMGKLLRAPVGSPTVVNTWEVSV